MIATVEKDLEKTGKVLPDGWRWVKLGDICELNPSRPRNLQYSENNPTTFVPMSSVDAYLGEITQPEIKIFEQVKKGYTYFQEEDILFAKITPCMQNGKHAIARNLINGFGFGTTEFHVIRPKEEIISDWIHRFLRQPTILEAATEHFTGSVGQQRIPISYLENLIIPLPPLAEQKRIVAILNEKMAAIDKARNATLIQIEATKALPAAYLRQIFNSPEAQTWERKKLGDHVQKIGSGITPRGGQTTYLQSGIPLIRSQNVHMNRFESSGLAYISSEQDDLMKPSRVINGDVLLNITGASIGRVCVVPEELCPANVNQHVSIIRGDGSFESNFLSFYISTPDFQKYILDAEAGATRQALTKSLIENFIIPFPPLSEQKKIVSLLNQKTANIEKLQKSLQNQLEAINALPAAILKQAFNGEL